MLSGCYYTIVRKTWDIEPSPSGEIIQREEFLELVNLIGDELGTEVIIRDFDPGYDPTTIIWLSKRKEDTLLPDWMGLRFDQHRFRIIVLFDKGFDKPKNKEKIDKVLTTIDHIVGELYDGRFPVKAEYIDKFKVPADII